MRGLTVRAGTPLETFRRMTKPTPYKPKQRTVQARVLSSAGWLDGTFHLMSMQHLADYLSHHAFYPLTNVASPELGQLGFFALARAETYLVIAPKLEAVTSALQTGALERHHATFVFPGGTVEGQLDLLQGLRLLDYADRTTGFVSVSNARVWIRNSRRTSAEKVDRLLLNPARLVGVTEPERLA